MPPKKIIIPKGWKPAKKKNVKRLRARLTRSLAVPQITVRRTCYLGTITPNTTATYGFWQYRQVSLSNGFYDQALSSMGGLTNVAEYQALFDQYKLCAFKITLRPRAVNMVNDQTATAAYGRDQNWVSVVRDPTDNISPTGLYTAATLNTFLESGKVKTFRGDKPVNIYMKPLVQEQYGGGSNRYVRPQWTDLTATGISMPHRGYHLFFHTNTLTSASLTPYDVFVTYYVKFRGMK